MKLRRIRGGPRFGGIRRAEHRPLPATATATAIYHVKESTSNVSLKLSLRLVMDSLISRFSGLHSLQSSSSPSKQGRFFTETRTIRFGQYCQWSPCHERQQYVRLHESLRAWRNVSFGTSWLTIWCLYLVFLLHDSDYDLDKFALFRVDVHLYGKTGSY